VLQLPYDNGTCRDTFDVLLRHRRIGAGLTITGRSDYGRTFAGQVVDGRQVVRNATQADVTVDSITVGAPFVVTSTVPAVPTVLRPGDSIVVITRYVASGSVDTVDLFVHTSAPCATRTGLQLRAAGDERAFCRVYIPLISAPIGAALDIPLMIDSASALESAGAYRFTATISFDQTLLYPEPHVSMSTSDGLRRVVVTGTRRDGSNVLALIPSTAMLGRVDTTDLTIESFEWIEPLVEFPTTTVDGIFWLENNCPEGGERQYIKSGVVILKPISPNPVAGAAVASFELVEPGRTRLTISDALGKLVSVVLDDDAVAGSFAIPLDLQSLLPGSYLLVLETPTQIRSQRFEVIR
jgi:hypothetical protein